jgi:chemotaxis family two-component system sensor kinase Cph1
MAACEAKPLALDLTYAALRSVSPICRRFYQNMGIQSRLLLSLNDNGKLWGFISCLSDGGHTIPYVDRLAYQGFAEMAALLLIEKEKAALQQQILFNKKQIAAITKGLEAACDFGVALQGLPQQLAGWLDVNGVALVRDAGITSVGEVPGVELINALAAWLDGQPDYFITDKLASVFGQADAFASSACGLVAIRLLEPGQYLLGLRPEWAHEVTWAGNPEKPMEIDVSHGEMRLTPRGSFAEWKQTVKGCARPWQAHEQDAWMELRQTVVFAQNAEKNRVLTVRLEESNQELESFAYIVSHDLQEPLRGIQNFSQLLNQEEATSDLGQRRTWLNAIMSLSGRMHSQIEALLQYSRASQQPLHISHVNLNQLLLTVQEDLAVPIAQSHALITVPKPLPDVYCDAVRLRAVFENLITNAIKYNSQIEKRIEIGFTDSLPLTFYVRDNGIGIKKGHEELIFTLFRRLHGRNEYGGGTGAGLTIAHKHISRQGGQIWLESVVGEGTTFYFTIAPEPQLIKLAST